VRGSAEKKQRVSATTTPTERTNEWGRLKNVKGHLCGLTEIGRPRVEGAGLLDLE